MVPMIGDEHLGKAVALRREFRGMSQVALARAIGVNKATMNGYERGSRGMDESTLERIAAVLECDYVDIWDDGYKIARFNYLRIRAEKTGVAIDELASRIHRKPSIEQIREAFHALGEKVWQLLASILTFLRPDRDYESQSGVPIWGVIVAPLVKAKRKRAIHLKGGKGNAQIKKKQSAVKNRQDQ